MYQLIRWQVIQVCKLPELSQTFKKKLKSLVEWSDYSLSDTFLCLLAWCLSRNVLEAQNSTHGLGVQVVCSLRSNRRLFFVLWCHSTRGRVWASQAFPSSCALFLLWTESGVVSGLWTVCLEEVQRTGKPWRFCRATPGVTRPWRAPSLVWWPGHPVGPQSDGFQGPEICGEGCKDDRYLTCLKEWVMMAS